jgi:hypothetical protein
LQFTCSDTELSDLAESKAERKCGATSHKQRKCSPAGSLQVYVTLHTRLSKVVTQESATFESSRDRLAKVLLSRVTLPLHSKKTGNDYTAEEDKKDTLWTSYKKPIQLTKSKYSFTLCPQSLFMGFVRILEQTAITLLFNIK